MRNFFQAHCVKNMKQLKLAAFVFFFCAINPKCHHERDLGLSLSLCGFVFFCFQKLQNIAVDD